ITLAAGNPALLASLLQSEGRLDEASQEYRKALKIDPRNASAHYGLAVVLDLQKNKDAAIAEYRRAIDLNPRKAIAYVALGLALLAQKEKDEALVQTLRAVKLAPRNADAHLALGVVQRHKNNAEEAKKEFEAAIKINPRNHDACLRLAEILLADGKSKEALGKIQEALKLAPPNASKKWKADAQIALAYAQINGDIDEAEKAAWNAVELDPSGRSYVPLGIMLLKKGQTNKAVDNFRTATEIDDSYSPGHFWLAIALLRLDGNNKDKAMAECDRAVKLDPGDPECHKELAKLLKARNQRADAIQAYLKVIIEINPPDQDAHKGLEELVGPM